MPRFQTLGLIEPQASEANLRADLSSRCIEARTGNLATFDGRSEWAQSRHVGEGLPHGFQP